MTLQFIFSVLCFFLCITNTYADECTSKELKELKQLASKIEVSYELDSKSDSSYFEVYVYNLNERMYIESESGRNYVYTGNQSNKQYLMSYKDGESFTFVVRGSYKTNCSGYKLASIKIELPTYNKYYNSEVCKSYEELNLCQKWYDSSKMTEEQFLEKINEYNASINSEENSWGIIAEVGSFILKYKIYFIFIMIMLIVLFIIGWFIKRKKRQKIDL